MSTALLSVPAWLLFIILVGGSMSVAWGATLRARRTFKQPVGEGHNDVIGFIFATAGVLYAVTLAFLIFATWDTFHTAETLTKQEAAALITVADDAGTLSPPVGHAVQQQVCTYIRAVINDEWKTMAQATEGEERSPRAVSAFAGLWTIYRRLQPLPAYDTALAALDDLTHQRQLRLLSSTATLPNVFWLILLGGAIITITGCLFLRMESVRLHACMTALLTGIIFLSLWLVLELNHPFSGDIHVPPDAFAHASKVLRC